MVVFVDFPGSGLSGGTPEYGRLYVPPCYQEPAPEQQMWPLTCLFHKLSQLTQGRKEEGREADWLSSNPNRRMVDVCALRRSNALVMSSQAPNLPPAYGSEVAQVQQDPTGPGKLEHEVMASQAPTRGTRPMFVCFWPTHSPLGCWLQGQPHPCSDGAIICAYKEPGQSRFQQLDHL